VRGNVQPGDVILAIISRGTTTEAKTAEQVNALLGRLEKGASVAMRLRRGDATFIATVRLNNGE
jgi:serine protease Do